MTAAASLRLSRRFAALVLLLPFLLPACTTSEPPAPEPVMPVAAEPLPAPPAAVAVEPPAPPPVPLFAGHVASYGSLTDAEAAWPRLVERFPVLRETTRRFVDVDLGGQRGRVTRLLVGGFPDQPGALAYCRTLRSAGLYCAPHALPG